jgi:hypothetical protein
MLHSLLVTGTRMDDLYDWVVARQLNMRIMHVFCEHDQYVLLFDCTDHEAVCLSLWEV